jgi:hypothetical protein
MSVLGGRRLGQLTLMPLPAEFHPQGAPRGGPSRGSSRAELAARRALASSRGPVGGARDGRRHDVVPRDRGEGDAKACSGRTREAMVPCVQPGHPLVQTRGAEGGGRVVQAVVRAGRGLALGSCDRLSPLAPKVEPRVRPHVRRPRNPVPTFPQPCLLPALPDSAVGAQPRRSAGHSLARGRA